MNSDTVATIIDVARALRIQAMKAYLMTGQATKTEGTYNRQIWRAIRELYNGEIDEFAFIDDVNSMIDNQFGRAWREGAREMNVSPAQMTDDDYTELARRMAQEQGFMLRLADDILMARQQQKPALTAFRARADMWANRYNELVNDARAWFGGRQMLEWVMGDTEHCDDCLRLNGTVAPAREWAMSRWKPQSHDLQCHGYNCRCSLEVTDKAPTDGGIPG